jgi:hypothetical protein
MKLAVIVLLTLATLLLPPSASQKTLTGLMDLVISVLLLMHMSQVKPLAEGETPTIGKREADGPMDKRRSSFCWLDSVILQSDHGADSHLRDSQHGRHCNQADARTASRSLLDFTMAARNGRKGFMPGPLLPAGRRFSRGKFVISKHSSATRRPLNKTVLRMITEWITPKWKRKLRITAAERC